MSSPTPHAEPRDARIPFRPDIEGLRAVAIIAVVLFHTGWKLVGGGFFGVDVFFVLSGFLITSIAALEISRTGSISLSNFWARRARRLLPAAALVTVFVLVANATLRISPFVQILIAKSARAFALYGSNILFAIRSTDYFGAIATHDPLLHTWSLSVEEQFYLFFAPLLLLFATALPRNDANAFWRRARLVISVLSAVSLIGCLLLVQRYPVIAFYALPARAWEFGLGALTALTIARAPQMKPATMEVVSLIALAMILGTSITPGGYSLAPLGAVSLLPTLGTVALLFTGAGAYRTVVARGLSLPPVRLIGRLSYSWYLWHWPIMVYLREIHRNPPLFLSIGVAVLSLVPAAIAYALVERPIHYSRRLTNRTALLGGAVALALLTYVAGMGADRYATAVISSPRVARVLAARVTPKIYADGCEVPLLGVESPPCVYGPARNDTSVVLFGDSHAAHWFPALDSVASLRGWKLVNLTKMGCPSSSVAVTYLGREYFECERWRTHALERIVKMRPTIVIIANDKTYDVRVGEQWQNADTSAMALGEWTRGLERTVSGLAPSGARLVLLGDTPEPVGDIPQCLVKYVDQPARCDRPTRESMNRLVSTMEASFARAAGNVAYINLNEYLCDESVCPAMKDGVVRYSDSNHLSVAFSASLAPVLSDRLTAALSSLQPE